MHERVFHTVRCWLAGVGVVLLAACGDPWAPTEHPEGSFPLKCGHAGAACESCHAPNEPFDAADDRCVSCHLAERPDSHDPDATATCSGCHSTCGWPELIGGNPHPDDYDRPELHGVESHLQVLDCTSCHGEDWTGGSAQGCDGCHADGGHEDWRSDCTYCHGGADGDTEGMPPRRPRRHLGCRRHQLPGPPRACRPRRGRAPGLRLRDLPRGGHDRALAGPRDRPHGRCVRGGLRRPGQRWELRRRVLHHLVPWRWPGRGHGVRRHPPHGLRWLPQQQRAVHHLVGHPRPAPRREGGRLRQLPRARGGGKRHHRRPRRARRRRPPRRPRRHGLGPGRRHLHRELSRSRRHAMDRGRPPPWVRGARGPRHRLAAGRVGVHRLPWDRPAWGGSGVGCDECHEAGWRADCAYCHGGESGDTDGLPPQDLDNQTSEAASTFDAHREHGDAVGHPDYPCAVCHPSEGYTDALLDVGHWFDSTPGVSEVSFDGSPQGGGTYNNGTCSNVYCHGDGRGTGTVSDGSTAMACDSCHPGTNDWNALSGEHDRHREASDGCQECHKGVVNLADGIVGDVLHVDVDVDVDMTGSGITWNGTTCSGGQCHGEEHSHTNDPW